ncbi:type II toxin-antitoxin system HigB family toxin [Photorhabdus temperata]|uniref:Cytoplasmic protein n=1 Tax=Photorhabdus temperata J3 TaxID=1389415 RepID=U7R110_PHOTE|nr:type II toxin-antitoxin system HigB family toxin [Photorhabdus temperata]ERT13192.1 hypothetical protein O185_10005 [Photorhabdus temperata J3]
MQEEYTKEQLQPPKRLRLLTNLIENNEVCFFIKKVFSEANHSLDRMKYREKWWVIDVGGNNLRVMFFADFERGKIFIKHISTHAEYDKLTDYYRRNKE